uniref:Solute carrier family 22 member 13b n=1 Tax=Sinocyclocheilus grahami TaxID=75366 RepID=A0A672QVG3_SINGR
VIDFAQILSSVGEFGAFRKRLLVAVCLLNIFTAFHMFGQVFTAMSFPHYSNSSWIFERAPSLTEEKQLNLTIPQDSNGQYESCKMFTPVDLEYPSFHLCHRRFVTSLVYYGVSLNVGNFGLDIYLTQLIFGIRFGRRLCQSVILLLGGTACLIIPAIPAEYPVIVTVIDKFSLAVSFTIVYVYTAELYPTVVRQNGVGLNSMFARVAGILAPLIGLLDVYHPAIPMVIYDTLPFVTFLLPETLNTDLQDHTDVPVEDSMCVYTLIFFILVTFHSTMRETTLPIITNQEKVLNFDAQNLLQN